MSSGIPKCTGPSVADCAAVESLPADLQAAIARYYEAEMDSAYSRGYQDGWADARMTKAALRAESRVAALRDGFITTARAQAAAFAELSARGRS